MRRDPDNGAEPSPPPSQRSNRGSVLTVLVLMAAGAALTAWGISGAPASDDTREPAAVRRATQAVPIDAALAQRGAGLQQLNCAGCHAGNGRLVGPGFLEIARQYRHAANPLAAISAAILHPPPGLAGYPPGPPQGYLSSADRDAIAGWILESSRDAR